jgi:hypothetical protein
MNAPVAKRKTLVLLAGIVWSAVGTGLMVAAAYWVLPYHSVELPWIIAGCIAGVIIFRFGFSRLVKVNITRIFAQAPGKDRVCLFAFQNTRSYIIVIVMMAMGYTLRHLPISKMYIMPIYAAIGLAMLLSSLIYYRHLVN